MMTEKPLLLRAVSLAICAMLASCGPTRGANHRGDMPCRESESNSVIKTFDCGAAYRRDYILAHTSEGATHGQLKRIGDDSVIDIRTGTAGRIDYLDATAMTLDGDTGIVVVPIRLHSGKWIASVWSVAGEFEKYAGVHDLTP
jgi:hypothetical protein